MAGKRIIFATANEDKMTEIRQIMEDLGIEVVSMREAGVFLEVEENGTSFEENALIKAKALCEKSGEITLADDSGLEVDYLNKEPGIYSARYLGRDTPYSKKNAYIIDRLKEAVGEERSARFVCAVAVAFPDGRSEVVRETMEGQIARKEAGVHGFGYDPIFFLPEYGCTSAELSPGEKNKISHRGKALRVMKEKLIELKVLE
ncbi:MAG: RdgB/HAM1 family non-canonical purine NTP pyrophosphatase [Lachnospiraceae bacterium]|nr:RdgB/HAM1 family non-canonical purine NTP pyrophosphatase [Lachnospiraceae bacterium]